MSAEGSSSGAPTETLSETVLSSPRLELRPLEPSDTSRLLELLRKPDVRRYLLDDSLVERDWVESLVERSRATFAEGTWGLWGLRRHDRDELLGFAGFCVFSGDQPELIYALDPDAWGRGLAEEAARTVCSHALGRLGWESVEGSTDPPNRASMRVMERIGMMPRGAAKRDGHDLVFYELRSPAPRSPNQRLRVAVICTHNSARSQMAEGLLRGRWGQWVQASSAGSEKTRVKDAAMAAMAERGFPLDGHSSKTIDEIDPRQDVVVTVCDSAREACPYLPARVLNLHHAFDDPSSVEGEQRAAAFARARDEIESWLELQVGGWLQAAREQELMDS